MALLVYMTAADPAEAERIAVELVERRLAAGVNILAPMRSVYRWKGEVRNAGEIPLVAQSEEERFPALAACVRELHSYETPCIIAVPIAAGTTDFLDWIAACTA